MTLTTQSEAAIGWEDVDRSSSGKLAEEPVQHVGQGRDCSQVENEAESDGTDWLLDELMRQWEEVSEVEEITVKKTRRKKVTRGESAEYRRACGGAEGMEEDSQLVCPRRCWEGLSVVKSAETRRKQGSGEISARKVQI